jgi:uncharacterized protein (TIGR02145 family)
MVLRFLFIAFLLLLGCGDLEFNNPTDPRNISHPDNIAYQSFSDARDGQTYKNVVIGNQTWMAENLNYNASGSFCLDKIERNGTIRDTLVSDGGYCDIYGRLYDWTTAKSVCPSGWHLPNEAEWSILLDFVTTDRGYSPPRISDITQTEWNSLYDLRVGIALMSKNGWGKMSKVNTSGIDTTYKDIYGFTAIPGGGLAEVCWTSSAHFCDLQFRSIDYGGSSAGWWAATQTGYTNEVTGCYASIDNSIQEGFRTTINNSPRNTDVLPVRCIKDGGTIFELCDGKTYDPATQRCKDNMVETLCGTEWFDATNTNLKCESGVLKTKCGNNWYSSAEWNPKTQYCSNGTTLKSYGKLTDERDNKTYKTVEIGTQTWMAENLNYDTTSSVCYKNSEANCTIYGRLYDWTTAMAACPSGWHLPDLEWSTLVNFVGASSGTKLKAISDWNNYEGKSGNGTNDYGFSALPSGFYSYGSFSGVSDLGIWWTSAQYYDKAYCRSMSNENNSVSLERDEKNSFFSVRCMKD